MSIRVRLLLSYVAMLIIPLVLSLVAAVVIQDTYLAYMRQNNPYSNLYYGSFDEWVQAENQVFDELKRTATFDPEQLFKSSYLASLEQRISHVNTGLIVRHEDTIIYTSRILASYRLTNRLPQFGSNLQNQEPILLGDNIFAVRKFDFYFNDQTPGSIFLLTDFSPIGTFALRYIFILGVAIMCILVVTNGVLTFLVSQSILKPIEALKRGAEEIKQGNLDFSVQRGAPDEIGQLCQSFEEMRLKLKESVERQQQYEDNRKELISSISHDLKTPITAIKGYTEGILDGVADSSEKVHKYIQTIHVKANDIDKLIDELFLYSKLDMHSEPFNFERVEIRSYLEHSTEELSFDLDKAGVNITFHTLLEPPVWVIADREKLKRVINNIVSNSVRYMDKSPGEISLYLTQTDTTITVQIQDNGPGIPSAVLPMIFSRFYRVDQSRGSSTGGSGLGLTIAKRIIEEHGGDIWVESQENKGTSIFLSLNKAPS